MPVFFRDVVSRYDAAQRKAQAECGDAAHDEDQHEPDDPQRQIENEIRKRESPDALVPVDRDPVPPEYTEQVRRYYERLGSGE